MPENWKTFTVEELIKDKILKKPLDGNHGGTHPKGKDFISSGIPFVMASDIIRGQVNLKSCSFISKVQGDKLRKGFAIEGDVLLTHKASIGRTAIVPKIETEYIMLTPQVTYYRISDQKQLNNHYLKFYFNSPAFQNELNMRAGSGSTRAYIGITDQQKLSIKVPPLQEQQSIASILSALDDKIELNLQMNKTLEEMAMALYKHWFVDFGPLQDGEFVDSELGEIPKGWESAILGDLINLNPRLSLPKGSQASFVEMKVLPIDVMSVSDVVQKEFKGGAKFQNGDTLFARITPCLENGKTAFVDFLESGEIAFGSTEFLVMRAKEGVSKYWTYCLARDTNFRNFAISTMVGTSGRQRVQNDPFLSYQIPQPPKEIFNSFSEIAEPWFTQIRINTLENQTLTQLRDTLLPKLISGEVRVKDVEKTLSEIL